MSEYKEGQGEALEYEGNQDEVPEYEENQGEVLFTASIIVCILRYLAIILPDVPFFAMLRSLEQAPQRYCLDFAIIMIFIVSSCIVLSRRTEKRRLLYWTEGISFAALVPAWRYIVDLFDWLETGDLSEITVIIRNARGIFQVLFISLAVCIFVGFIIVLLRYNDKIKKLLSSCIICIKKDIFLAQFISIMIIIHIIRLSILFFVTDTSFLYPQILAEIGGMDFVLTAAFFIALLMILLHCRKRQDVFTPAVWFAMVLCLFGMVPVRNQPRKIVLWFAIVAALVIVAVLLVWGYRYLCSGRIKQTKLWKNFDGDGMVELVENHMYDLSSNFVNVIFMPFRFLLSYLDMLGAALLDDDSDSDSDNDSDNHSDKIIYSASASDNDNNNNDDYNADNNMNNDIDKNMEHNDNAVKEKKNRKKVRVMERQDVKRLAGEGGFVKIKIEDKRIEGWEL